jgi:putative heme iron utilization protein
VSGHEVTGHREAPPEPPTAPAPQPSHAERARTLVGAGGRATLSTLSVEVPGTPFGSLVTYAADDAGRPVLFVSTLAEHWANLEADPRASLLAAEPAPDGADPLALGRLTLLGRAETLTGAAADAERERFAAVHPAAFYIGYGDFRCVRLGVAAVRYVGGFGRMSWVDAAAYAAARPDPLAPHAPDIVAHMNADHADALVELCHHRAGRTDVVAARMTAVDRLGFEVAADVSGPRRRAAFRIAFRAPQTSPGGVRRELVALLREARAAQPSA